MNAQSARLASEACRAEDDESLEAYYGLPKRVLFCRKCVISNQRPNSTVEVHHTPSERKATIEFDAEGVCAACRYAEMKAHSIDWRQREAELI
ncbi:MAG: hypothetical protein ACE5F9_15615, partial [Phycisphaerae bacterium]